MKKAKGITLIALVVTIVILLILAGITINLLFSNGGIYKVAQDTTNAWNEAIIMSKKV
ncbi:MAG: type II secretion system protein [Intestinibacter sp.]